jgi:hypothetical protein
LPRPEQSNQKVLSIIANEEAKWEKQFNELQLKVAKSCNLYDFCLNLLQNGRIRFPDKCTAGMSCVITPAKPQKQDRGWFSSALASMPPGALDSSHGSCCVSSFIWYVGFIEQGML